MALPVIANTLRVAVNGTLSDGNKFANIYHFRTSAILTTAAAVAIIDPKLLALYTSALSGGQYWTQLARTNAHLDNFTYTPLDGAGATVVVAHTNAGTQSTQDSLPDNVALVITEYTALRGRRNRGRSYWAGLTEGANAANGVLDPTTAAGLQTQWNAYLATWSGSGVSPVVATYGRTVHKNGSVTTWTPDAHDITSFLVRSTWHSQRKRLN